MKLIRLNPFFVRVSKVSVGGTLSGDIEACKGIGFSEFVLHDYTGDVHKWQTSLSAFGPWTDLSETSDKLKIENNGETRYYRVNVISGVCASDNSNAILHTVYEPTMAGQNNWWWRCLCRWQ